MLEEATLGQDRFGAEKAAADLRSPETMKSGQNYDKGVNSLSISIWVYMRSRQTTYNQQVIIEETTRINPGDGINLNVYNGQLRWIISYRKHESNGVVAVDDSYLPLNKWTNILCTYNDGVGAIFIDGVRRGYRDDLIQMDNIGGHVFGGSHNRVNSFDGLLDDIRFYNRALSATEVAQLYAYESQPQPSSNTRKATAMAQVVNGFIVGAEIIDGGYGYTSNPEVTITGEGGFGAIATATVSAGQVIKINIQNPGFGYTGNPTIDIAAPPVPPASAYATGEVVNGFLVGATLVTGGEGYNEAPQVTVTGGGGSGAVAVAQVEDGRLVAVNIINPGNGYTSTPVITIAAPPSAPELSIRVTQVEVNMKLTVGKRYTIEASKNMVDWVQAGDIFTAEEQFKAMKFDVDDFGQFYRVIEQP
jgi:hypothetical protein